jgi:HupE / UreJ protein
MGAGPRGARALSRAGVVIALALIALASADGSAAAHTGGSTAYATVTVQHSTVRYSLTLPTAALTSAMTEDLRLSWAGSVLAGERLLDVLRRTITLRGNGFRCEPGPGRVEPSPADAPSFTMLIDFACPAGLRELDVRDDIFDVLGVNHHTLAKVEWPGGTGQFAFEPAAREATFHLGGGSAGRDTGSFVLLGVEHILTGWDHLLFLLGLLLRAGSWLALAKIITAFTLAHSVTLTLAVLDVVVLPDRLVEAVIALSIAFVAAENLFLRPVVARRWLVSFCFGLVHGFGFSSALRQLGLPSQGLLLSLFGFNVGVEVGQALVVAVALPVLLLVRNTRWERRVMWSSSVAILLVGVVLFFERAFF